MGWERDGRYYVRKRWDAGRVVSEYIGTGPAAERAAAEDAEARAERAAAAARRTRERGELAALDGEYAALRDLVAAHLLAAGFHQHRRQWRRIREQG
jgi:hypothetical protein